MRILITTDWYAPIINGVVTSVLNLESQLRKMGNEVRVLTLSQNCRSYVKGDVTYIGSLGAGVIYPNARMKIPVRSKYITDIINWKPDIIHSQCEFSTFMFAKKISKILGIPIIHTYHTVYEDYTHYFSPNEKWGKKAVMKFSKWITSSCERVIAPTEKVRAMLESYNISCPISVIPSGIDLEKFYRSENDKVAVIKRNLGIKNSDFVLVYIGRLAEEKNVDELIKMEKYFESDNIKLLIVGDGPYREKLEKTVLECGVSDKVIFAGMAAPEDVGAYYKCGDVFVSASSSETQGLTYIEALASGLPVICKKDKCLDGVIDDVMNGFQYVDESEFINVINELSQKPEYVHDMSINAFNSSKKFSSENFGKKVFEAYRQTTDSYGKKLSAMNSGVLNNA